MTPQPLSLVDDGQLRTIELDAAALCRAGLLGGAAGDARVRRYLDALPPQRALELIDKLREYQRALGGALAALESAGYTLEAYSELDESARATPAWSAVHEAWAALGSAPKYLLRYTRGDRRGVRAFPTREAALEAAIESLEMCESYPESIEFEGGGCLMDRAAILHAWEDRHDPG